LYQYELRNQLWLQLSPLDSNSSLRQPHDLSLEQRSAASRPAFGRNLYGDV
jgi:hypothetical protein